MAETQRKTLFPSNLTGLHREIIKCIAKFNIGEIDADTSLKISKQILVDEFDDEEFLNFAIEHYSEMFGYINTGRINIKSSQGYRR